MNVFRLRFRTLFALVASMAIAAGCATVQDEETRAYIQPGTTDLVVTQLQFRGVDNISERNLRAGLATQEDPGWRADRWAAWMPVVGDQRRYFNRFAWQQDRERILAYYRQQGYFHATIESESIIEDPEAGTVRIRVTINEGEPTRITSLELHGLIEGVTPDRDTLLRDLQLGEEDIFVQQQYRGMRTALRDRLQQAGHAYADVSGRVYIHPETREAEVHFFLDPGPKSRMGPVYILGLDEIEERSVRRAIPFREGDDYSPQKLSRAQEEIFDLGVFGMVTVLPAHEARDTTVDRRRDQEELDTILDQHDLPEQQEDPEQGIDTDINIETDDERAPLGISSILADAQRHGESRSRLDPEVPIVIRVQEATGYNLRVGAGITAESTRQDTRALANWSARNFLGGLRRLQHFNSLGYAWAPGLLTPEEMVNRGLVLSSELRFQQPQFIEPRTNLTLRARVERDVREGFSMWNPSFRMGLERPFFDHWIVAVGYNAAYFNYFNVERGLIDVGDTQLGLDFQTEFLLEYFEQAIAYDRRDDIIDPTSGYLIDLTVQQAGGFAVGGEFDFIKPIVSAEGYVPLGLPGRSVLALRSRLGAAYDIGRETGVPHQSRVYSGGADGMRSFGRRRLSLYTATGEAVPIGGLTQFEASVEPRFRLVSNLADIGDLWGAVFLDSSTVLGEQLMFDTEANRQGTVDIADIPSTLLYGAGLGAWWNTPVGPVRLDVAYTLSDLTDDARFRRCDPPQDYGDPDCERIPVEEDPIQNLLTTWGIRGWGFYLSIGHSF